MSRRDGRPAPRPLGDVMAGIVGQRGWSERLRAARIHDLWPEVAGPDVARHAVPVRLAGGVLVLEVADPAWATQLRYLVPQLVEGANRALGEPLVRDVVIRMRGPGGPTSR